MSDKSHIKRDIEDVARRLKAWLPDGDKVTGLRVLSAGHSNETFFIEGLNRILRMPPSNGGLVPPYDMVKQHRILAAVGEMKDGPPVPAVYEVCDDPEVLGDPFFVMEALVGEDFEYAPPQWLLDAPESQRTAMSKRWLDAFTSLHTRPASEMPEAFVDTKAYAQDCLRMAQVPNGDKKLIALLEDFVKNPLPTSGEPTPVHGDPKIGNMMWRPDGHLVAVLDWEMAFVGEPMHDLGWALCLYNQPLASAGLDLPGWLQPEAMAERWEAHTGRSSAHLERFMVLAFARVCAITTWGAHLYLSGQADDERYAAWDQGMPTLLSILFSRADKA